MERDDWKGTAIVCLAVIAMVLWVLANVAGCVGVGPMADDGFLADPPYGARHYGR